MTPSFIFHLNSILSCTEVRSILLEVFEVFLEKNDNDCDPSPTPQSSSYCEALYSRREGSNDKELLKGFLADSIWCEMAGYLSWILWILFSLGTVNSAENGAKHNTNTQMCTFSVPHTHTKEKKTLINGWLVDGRKTFKLLWTDWNILTWAGLCMQIGVYVCLYIFFFLYVVRMYMRACSHMCLCLCLPGSFSLHVHVQLDLCVFQKIKRVKPLFWQRLTECIMILLAE